MATVAARRIAAGGAAWLLTVVGALAATSTAGSGDAGAEGARAVNQVKQHASGHDGHSKGVLRALLQGVDGRLVGWVTLRQTGDLVVVRGWAQSLTPGFHGFHIHTTGLCQADAATGPFMTAGGHFTRGTETHGDHAGDMPSLLVTQDGTAFAQFVTDRFVLADLLDADGSAVMVHDGRDNFANIPLRYSSGGIAGPDATTLATGDAGTRAACGVIR